MLIIPIEQNTPEWHNYRRTRIGASDFNYFCKHKGFYTPYYKVKKDDTLENHFYNKINNIEINNPFITIGHELEPFLLEEYNKLTGGCYVPTVGQYDDNSDIFASFDGYDVFTNRIVEIKTTSKSLEFENQLLKSYIYQCAHQMHVANIDKMVILINYYNYGVTRHYTINKHYKFYFYIAINFLEIELLQEKMDKIEWFEHCTEYLELLKETTK